MYYSYKSVLELSPFKKEESNIESSVSNLCTVTIKKKKEKEEKSKSKSHVFDLSKIS